MNKEQQDELSAALVKQYSEAVKLRTENVFLQAKLELIQEACAPILQEAEKADQIEKNNKWIPGSAGSDPTDTITYKDCRAIAKAINGKDNLKSIMERATVIIKRETNK